MYASELLVQGCVSFSNHMINPNFFFNFSTKIKTNASLSQTTANGWWMLRTSSVIISMKNLTKYSHNFRFNWKFNQGIFLSGIIQSYHQCQVLFQIKGFVLDIFMLLTLYSFSHSCESWAMHAFVVKILFHFANVFGADTLEILSAFPLRSLILATGPSWPY